MKKLIGILVGAVAISCVAVAQNSAPAAKPAAAPAKTTAPAAPKAGEKLPMGMTPEQMQKMMDAGTPGAAHKALEAFNGKWNVTVKSWMNGLDSTPEESTGTAEFKMALGGRVQEQTFAGTFGGMPFEGMGCCGYDNTAKKYWSMWTDSMSTNYMMSNGTADAAGKTFTYDGTYECPVFGHCSSKSVLKWNDANSFTFTMNATSKNGPPSKMELTYTRAK